MFVMSDGVLYGKIPDGAFIETLIVIMDRLIVSTFENEEGSYMSLKDAAEWHRKESTFGDEHNQAVHSTVADMFESMIEQSKSMTPEESEFDVKEFQDKLKELFKKRDEALKE